MLGDGWYRGRLGFGGGRRNIYGDRLALLAQLEIDLRRRHDRARRHRRDLARRDGPDPRAATSTTAKPTTPAWSGPAGPRPAYDDSDWAGVRAARARPGHPRRARRAAGAPHRDARAGRDHHLARPGATIVDFGQNLVGRLRIDGAGAGRADDHAAPRRGARGRRAVHPPAARRRRPPTATRCAAAGVETWEPRFTFHGFRYAEVDGLAGRAASRTTSARSSATPTWSAPAGSSARTR